MRHNWRCGIHRRGELPRPAGWGSQPLRIPCSRFPCVLALNNSSRVPLSHVAPLGLKIFVHAACYKHAAPLGLNTPNGDSPSHFPLSPFPRLRPCVKISLTSRRAPGAGTGSAAASGYPSVSSVLTDSAVQPGHRPAVPTHR